MNILFAWLGRTDVKASEGDANAGLGPIGQAVSDLTFDELILLSDLERSSEDSYCQWLSKIKNTPIRLERIKLADPTDFGEIYEASRSVIEKRLGQVGARHKPQLSFHLSPGTPAMAAVWIILAKTRFPADLIQSSKERGVRIASLPFDISAEYIPDLLRQADKKLESLVSGIGTDVHDFEDVLFQSKTMANVVSFAKRIALHRVPVLIEGESGTGKEVFAKAIHKSGARGREPFVTVNCGAIPEQLVESELFGHKKGAFSGADKDRAGHFAEADGGTIFLDEIGELTLAAQVKLLRVLQESEVTPIGSSTPRKIDVRVISATNRNLIDEVINGSFREDLFYRLAVFVLKVPPLREREGDVGLLINAKLKKINEDNRSEIWPEDKQLYPTARNLLLRHRWPGNVRELEHTLLRAAVISNGPKITEKDVERALFSFAKRDDGVLGKRLGDGFDIEELLAEVSRHYLSRALIETNNNKTKAAGLVGLSNYQTFTNWMVRCGLADGT